MCVLRGKIDETVFYDKVSECVYSNPEQVEQQDNNSNEKVSKNYILFNTICGKYFFRVLITHIDLDTLRAK